MPIEHNIDIYDPSMTESEAMEVQENVKYIIAKKNYQPRKITPPSIFLSIDKLGKNKK